jgi:hypothetical protein
VANAPFENESLASLVEEFVLQRRANILHFRAFTPEAWSRSGIASDNSISVRALVYIMVGHVRHHLEVLRSRYREA